MACKTSPVLADACRKQETGKTSGKPKYLNQDLTLGNLSNPVCGEIEYEELQMETADKPRQLPVLFKNSTVRRKQINKVYVLFGLIVALLLAIIGIVLALAFKFPKEKETPGGSDWGIWSSWGRCSSTCDLGMSTRVRFCVDPTPIKGGNNCQGDLNDYKLCNKLTNGQWSSWSSWSSCLSSTCMKTRNRTCDNPLPSARGLMCLGNSVDKENCDLPACTFPSLQVQLTNGTTSHGELEVSLDGKTWGNVCAGRFDTKTAMVACRMLGYSGNRKKSVVFYEFGVLNDSLPIFLNDLKCFGTEASLLFCGHAGWGKGDCGDRKYVGVSCT